jgi:hypothetical protein
LFRVFVEAVCKQRLASDWRSVKAVLAGSSGVRNVFAAGEPVEPHGHTAFASSVWAGRLAIRRAQEINLGAVSLRVALRSVTVL